MNVIKQCRYGLMIYNNKDIWQGTSFEKYGEYSEEEVVLFKKLIKKGDIVLDVGANIGSHTLPFAHCVGKEGGVVAFEPERRNFYILCGNIAVNNLMNTFAFQQALGNVTGFIKVPELNYEATENFGGLELNKDYPDEACYTVRLETIDNLLLPKVNFIKIDVEGMELEVLQGAVNKIKEFKPYLYVEDDRKDRSKELREFILSLDYKIYEHIPYFFNPDNFAGEKEYYFITKNLASFNLFCHHKSIKPPSLKSLKLNPA